MSVYRKQWCSECRTEHPRYHLASPGVRYRQAEPYHLTWQQIAVDAAKDAGEIILGIVVLLALFIGVPLLLWVAFA